MYKGVDSSNSDQRQIDYAVQCKSEPAWCISVADPGPLMLGVLDWWTPTVNVLQTLITQISFHIELYPIEARDSISLYTTPLSIWPSGFRDFFFHFNLSKKANVPDE